MKELAQKIKGYQEQIASLNSKCKMLAVKAKHATMLLTVSDIEGQQEMDEKLKKFSGTTVRKQFWVLEHALCQLQLNKYTNDH